jgi:hypothetical protein
MGGYISTAEINEENFTQPQCITQDIQKNIPLVDTPQEDIVASNDAIQNTQQINLELATPLSDHENIPISSNEEIPSSNEEISTPIELAYIIMRNNTIIGYVKSISTGKNYINKLIAKDFISAMTCYNQVETCGTIDEMVMYLRGVWPLDILCRHRVINTYQMRELFHLT